MPKYAIVVADPDTVLAGERARGFRTVQRRPVGTVHAELDSACPNGLPNCRNCGDPDHVVTCRAAGHCPQCGTAHGIAPDAVLVRHGFRLEPR